MNTEFFIAKKIISSKDNSNKLSKPMVRISIIGVAISFIIMILSISITSGFKKVIKDKIVGFAGSVQIVNYDSNNSFETESINKNQDFVEKLKKTKGIKHIQIFATKPGIIKTSDQIEGVILKGVGKDFDWQFFKNHIIKGEIFTVTDTTSNKIIISNKIADLLNFNVGDKLLMYFVQEPPRMRKFIVSGIFQTGIEEVDKNFVIVDYKHIQKLNNWDENQISGFQIFTDDFNNIDKMTNIINDEIGYNYSQKNNRLKVENVKQIYSQLFEWTELFNTNIIIILVLMIAVAGFNMISGLLILIIERTNMIGILKAIGAENWSIRKVFLYNAIFLTGKGMLWGNLIGISIALLQKYFMFIKLDAEAYYMSTVPIDLNFVNILLLNMGGVVVTFIMLMIPSYIISKISPSKAIKFN